MQAKPIARSTVYMILVGMFALVACRPATPSPSAAVPAVTMTATMTPAAAPTSAPAATAAPAATDTAAPAAAMDAGVKRVESFLDGSYKFDLFSGAALIARDGQIVLSKGYGLADHNSKTPNTPQTIFRIGELSMQFTAAAMLLLEQDGKLRMPDGICKYLDPCPEAWKDITLHHLLSHTSGIPEYFDTAAGQQATRDGATPQQLLTIFQDQPLTNKPGAQRVFSHSGFVLAGLIIERVSGQSYGEFVTQHVFVPLGMTHSGYGDPPSGSAAVATGYSSSVSTTPSTFNISALYAAGGCYSTAEDLYRWNEGLHNAKLLDAAHLKKMLTAHAEMSDPNSKSGYGIVLFELAGHKAAGNGGGPDNFGYASVLYRFIDDHVTLVLVTNQPMSNQFEFMDQIGKLYFGVK